MTTRESIMRIALFIFILFHQKSFNFAEGFSFTEGTLRLVTNGIDKLDELKIKIDTPAVTRKILSEDSITQKQSELNLWLNSLN